MKRVFSLLIPFLALACGELGPFDAPADEEVVEEIREFVNVHVTAVPLTSVLDDPCAQEADLLNMEAVLRMGGHQDCHLDINAVTLGAMGSCDRITVGVIRPVVVVYRISDGSDSAELAYDIGYVDLRKDALPPGDSVSLYLGNDGVDSVLIHTPAQVSALPPADAATATSLDEARQWAAVQIESKAESVDRDCDDISNLEELCDNGLAAMFADPLCS